MVPPLLRDRRGPRVQLPEDTAGISNQVRQLRRPSSHSKARSSAPRPYIFLAGGPERPSWAVLRPWLVRGRRLLVRGLRQVGRQRVARVAVQVVAGPVVAPGRSRVRVADGAAASLDRPGAGRSGATGRPGRARSARQATAPGLRWRVPQKT